MRLTATLTLALATALGFNVLMGQDVPAKLVFTARNGNVTFDHAAHAKRAGDCTACHNKLFTQSKDPLNFKAGLHKTAETAQTSCGGCHHPGGKAFETKANCARCHTKG